MSDRGRRPSRTGQIQDEQELGPACSGRSGEHVIATSNASAAARTRMMWFKALRLDIATRFLVLISGHTISSGY